MFFIVLDGHHHQFLSPIYDQQNTNQSDKVVQEYFHYYDYYFSFYSNRFIIFKTKIFSKFICFYHTWINVKNLFISKIFTNVYTLVIIDPLTRFYFVLFHLFISRVLIFDLFFNFFHCYIA